MGSKRTGSSLEAECAKKGRAGPEGHREEASTAGRPCVAEGGGGCSGNDDDDDAVRATGGQGVGEEHASHKRDAAGENDGAHDVQAGHGGDGAQEEEDTDAELCGICLEDTALAAQRGFLDACSHVFCFECILRWSEVSGASRGRPQGGGPGGAGSGSVHSCNSTSLSLWSWEWFSPFLHSTSLSLAQDVGQGLPPTGTCTELPSFAADRKCTDCPPLATTRRNACDPGWGYCVFMPEGGISMPNVQAALYPAAESAVPGCWCSRRAARTRTTLNNAASSTSGPGMHMLLLRVKPSIEGKLGCMRHS